MLHHLPVPNQNTWGVHVNFERFLASPPTSPNWLAPLQQQDWQRRGLVVWDADIRLVTHLYARHALDVLEHMKAIEEWKASGFLLSSPTTERQDSCTKQRMEIGPYKTK